MTVFFTADTHFGHKRTAQLSKRPFDTVSEMNSIMIDRWNEVVSLGDVVYHLGDFGDTEMVHQLNGGIVFLPGNYDTDEVIEILGEFCKIIPPNQTIEIDGHKFQLVHEPEEATPGGEFFLFGHIHKLQMVKRNGLNVGVDCHNFYPISLETVLFYRNAIQNHYDENVFLETLAMT